MIRNIRAFSLVLSALVALSAIAASAAVAVPEFTASTYPATVTGSNTKGSEIFKTEAGGSECDSHFVSNSLNASSSTITIAPTYTGCESFGFLEATWNTEGCVYVLHATELTSEGFRRHHFDISCPAGKSIKITSGTCKVEIKAQTGATTVSTSNAGSSITLQWELKGLAYTVTQDGFLCSYSGTGNKTDMTYTGHVVLSRVGGGSVAVSGG